MIDTIATTPSVWKCWKRTEQSDHADVIQVATRLLRSAGVAIGVFASVTCLEIQATCTDQSQRRSNEIVENPVAATQRHHLTSADRMRDVVKHPAFGSFGPLILPWDNRPSDTNMLLRDIGSLLPYHSHVDPDGVVSALNHLIDEVKNGKTIFYSFYADAEKQAEPGRSNTGLFFVRGRPGAPFAIVAPGGGFAYVASVHEGFPYAVEISHKGFNAFVLKYRAGCGSACAIQDLAAAISFVFRNAEMLGVGTKDYSLWGSSAGARLAAAIGSHGVRYFGGADLPKPSTVVMAYTGHSDHSSDEPATFVVVGEQDTIAPASVMQRRFDALRRSGTDVEFHKYPNLGHGFGPGTGTSAEGWIADAIRFWAQRISKG
jgi:acetyl esterase/lipase